MIPYFQYNLIIVGPAVIQVWGLWVAAGIFAAVLLMNRLADKYFMSKELLLDLAIWILFSSFIFARIFHVVFYNFEFYSNNLFEIVKFWEGGLSSLGGFFGALIAIYIFARNRHIKSKEFWPYLDVMAVSFWLGWGIGRIGCFFIHDHPGKLSDFFLAVNFPEGARHDLGLYEAILGFAIFTVFIYFFKKLIKKRWGLIAVFSSLSYAVVRFFLDFLRATDVPQSDARYNGLTPAQWGMIAVVIGLTALLFSGKLRQTSNGRIA